jgi:4'-phosphopantetheinyl transferase
MHGLTPQGQSPDRKDPMDVYWLEQTQEDLPATNEWLSGPEVARLNTLRFPKRREEWRLGRWTGKRAVDTYLGLGGRFDAIELVPAADGAPEVFVDNRPAAVAVSLSHRAGSALCAITQPEVALGCDLELIEAHSNAFIQDFFSAEEQALIAANRYQRELLVALFWSGKESVLKALRIGLRMDTRQIDLTPAETLSWSTAPRPELQDACAWRLLPVRKARGKVFHGWWRNSGRLVRTLVACPPATPPVWLGG